ncbi:hypothetical protein HK102_001018 [Quaeritorhiza haematococci]|nr:hypothetical protein HK102_001018 [Quaeritorhiza haematococci]
MDHVDTTTTTPPAHTPAPPAAQPSIPSPASLHQQQQHKPASTSSSSSSATTTPTASHFKTSSPAFTSAGHRLAIDTNLKKVSNQQQQQQHHQVQVRPSLPSSFQQQQQQQQQQPCRPLSPLLLPSSTGCVAYLIMKKQTSISFFILFEAPDKNPTFAHWWNLPSNKKNHGKILFSNHLRQHHHQHYLQDLSTRLNARLVRASSRRAFLLQERRFRLQRRFEKIKYRTLLNVQRQKLLALKRRARIEYAISAATLRRHISLSRSMERARRMAMVGSESVDAASTGEFSMDVCSRSEVEEFTRDEDDAVFDFATGTLECETDDVDDVDDDDQVTAVGDAGSVDLSASGTTTSFASEALDSPMRLDAPTSSILGRAPSASPAPLSLPAVPPPFLLSAETIKRTQTLLPPAFFIDPGLNSTSSIAQNIVTTHLVELLPPITRFTLRELDLDEILNNAQLRHDLFFDPNLQFKPNTEGERGIIKQRNADAYWNEVESEIQAGSMSAEGRLSSSASTSSLSSETSSTSSTFSFPAMSSPFYRIPLLLNEIHHIILELLPFSPDLHSALSAHFDMPLITQQISHGIFSWVVPLITYVANLLKANCAPARDPMVDDFEAKCLRGEFVPCLRGIFEVLEIMKLDYANHQLHRIRPYIVENAVDFEWNWFKSQIQHQSATSSSSLSPVEDTTRWLTAALQRARDKHGIYSLLSPRPAPTTKAGVDVSEAYYEGLLYLIHNANNLVSGGSSTSSASGQPHPFPETFRMDFTRLATFQNDYQDITIMAALLLLFRQYAAAPAPSGSGSAAAANMGGGPTAEDVMRMKKILWVLLNDSETSMRHVAVAIAEEAGKVRSRRAAWRVRIKSGEDGKDKSKKKEEREEEHQESEKKQLYFSDRDVETLASMIDKTLTPDSGLYRVLQNRVAVHLFGYLTAASTAKKSTPNSSSTSEGTTTPEFFASSSSPSRFNHSLAARHGLSELEEEITDLAQRIKRLADHNWAVYAPVYGAVYEEVVGAGNGVDPVARREE